jgi:hypothetical protein
MKSIGLLLIACLFSLTSFSQECPDSCKVFIPNNLTPDCDGVDCEILEITCNCKFEEFHLMIFNRWGELIFESEDPVKKFNSKGLSEDFYIWKLSAEFCKGRKINSTGNIYILR